jgi:hypothetical protein
MTGFKITCTSDSNFSSNLSGPSKITLIFVLIACNFPYNGRLEHFLRYAPNFFEETIGRMTYIEESAGMANIKRVCEVEEHRGILRNIEEWTGETHGESKMVEKESNKIEGMGGSKKQKEDANK